MYLLHRNFVSMCIVHMHLRCYKKNCLYVLHKRVPKLCIFCIFKIQPFAVLFYYYFGIIIYRYHSLVFNIITHIYNYFVVFKNLGIIIFQLLLPAANNITQFNIIRRPS